MLANFSRSRDNKFLHNRRPSQNQMVTEDDDYIETDRI